jgi:hypothetical protein
MSDDRLKVDFFLDSGAYSAYYIGAVIDIEKYAAFIHANKEKITVYANLDVINNGEASYENWMKLRAMGLNPLPVYHAGSDIKYLKMYMEKTDYIAIGAISESSTARRIMNLDLIWTKYITDERGYPRVRTHGFGLTSLNLIVRYPWYSVDSTTWLRQAMYGSIMVPKFRGGKYIYDDSPLIVYISNESPRRGVLGKHYLNYHDQDFEIIDRYIKEKGMVMGSSEFKVEDDGYELVEGERWALSDIVLPIETAKEINTQGTNKKIVERVIEYGITNYHAVRAHWNADFYQDVARSVPEYPWPFKYKRPTFGLGAI